MGRTLVALTLMLAAAPRASGQELQIDRARDLALHATVRAFLDNTISASQLDADLREYARVFEARPYRVRPAPIEWEKIPQERTFAFMRATARITGPAQQAFLKGELTAEQAALKMAPFFLIFVGYGIDPPPDDPHARLRIDELLMEIGKYH